MTDNHPITPPPELVEKLQDLGNLDAIRLAYQAGADYELQACINVIYDNELCDANFYNNLRAARRPKPPSLKEQALDALREAESTGCLYVNGRSDLIRRALEQLDD
jgi:hypothetical protein